MADAGRAPPASDTAELTAIASPLRAAALYLIATLPGEELDAASLDRLRAAAAGGVDAVQLRMKHARTDQRRAALLAARSALPDAVRLLINDDVDALFDARGAALADGVHLGRDDAAALAPAGGNEAERRAAGLRAARERLGPALALGSSTREPWEVELAHAAGADHLGFGAIALSTSKTDSAPASLDALHELARARPALPLFPIGGLTPTTLAELARRGIRRAAVGAAIFAARDPEVAARACRAALGLT